MSCGRCCRVRARPRSTDRPLSAQRVQSALQIASQVGLPEWVEVNDKDFKGVFKQVPARDDILPDINENLVVELYSK